MRAVQVHVVLIVGFEEVGAVARILLLLYGEVVVAAAVVQQ